MPTVEGATRLDLELRLLLALCDRLYVLHKLFQPQPQLQPGVLYRKPRLRVAADGPAKLERAVRLDEDVDSQPASHRRAEGSVFNFRTSGGQVRENSLAIEASRAEGHIEQCPVAGILALLHEPPIGVSSADLDLNRAR